MKLVVSFHGMCLCVLDRREGRSARGATVLLLNGAAAPRTSRRARARPRLPYHHPLLFVPAKHADVKRSTWSPLPTPEALVDTERLFSGRHAGWNLSGLDLTLGRGTGISLYENQPADAAGRLPDPAGTSDRKAYLDWRRIPDLRRIAPGARLRPAFSAIGPNVLGLVRFSGGELRGAVPKNLNGGAAAWRFSPTFDQVITDRFEFHTELPGADLVAKGFAGGRAQSIRITGAAGKVVRLAIVHEATPSDVTLYDTARSAARAAAGVDLPHYLAFYDAIQGAAVDALEPPRRSGSGPDGPRPSIDTPMCPPAVF